jgi:hypothetical protein
MPKEFAIFDAPLAAKISAYWERVESLGSGFVRSHCHTAACELALIESLEVSHQRGGVLVHARLTPMAQLYRCDLVVISEEGIRGGAKKSPRA